ncbi:MAG: LysR family transcriptional regulator [Oscillospiraceae bacterium]|nr:LysR family transcriptional regulator [Oscillospiraceae bacterium]
MELMQLKYFKTVAEIGKISDAASALFISAPALSTSISRLEKELGMPLFDRTNNRILLNRQGQIFLRYVNQIFSNLDCAKTELQQSILHQGQHVSIASVASTQWVDMITAFSQEHPRFTLSCTNVKRSELASNALPVQHNFLFASEEDIPPFYLGELESIVLFEDHPVVMVHSDHPLAKEASVSLSQLAGEHIFLPMQNYPLYDHLVKLFEASGIPFPAGNAYSHLAAQQMVAKKLGIAFSSEHTGRTPALPVSYVPIRDSYTPWVSRLYWRRDHIFTEDEVIFKAFVEKYYKN